MTRLVSVCILTYNQADYIIECLESVLSQQLDGPIEVLVGDDASSDGTSAKVAALAAAEPRVVHVRQPQRGGAVANLKAVLGLARGKYIARLDGDDFWLPGKLAAQVSLLEDRPDCAAAYTNAVVVDRQGHEWGRFNDLGDSVLSLADMVRRGNLLNTSSMVFRSQHVPDWLAVEGDFLDYRGHLLTARRGLLFQFGRCMTAYRAGAVGSMVSESNDRVRELYWQALMSVDPGMVSDRDWRVGVADFLRRVAFRAVSRRDVRLFVDWWRRAAALDRPSRLGLAGQFAVELASAAKRESWGLIGTKLSRHRSRVLYRGRA